jgi:GNAT superfamily N-acetyltransferase
MVEIRLITLEQTQALRGEVLRGGRTEALASPRDDLPETFHLGAVAVDGQIVATSTYFPAVCSYHPDVANAYQLRWMAVAPGHRGEGIGASILARALELLQERNVPLLWANSRDTALQFYLKNGFSTIPGSGFGHEVHGMPHTVVMRRMDV